MWIIRISLTALLCSLYQAIFKKLCNGLIFPMYAIYSVDFPQDNFCELLLSYTSIPVLKGSKGYLL